MTKERKMQQTVGQCDRKAWVKETERKTKGKKVGLNRLSERDSESAREREVRRQDGREGTPTARREERGKVSSPGQRAHHCQHHGTLRCTHIYTHLHTHAHTHTRLADGPPSCPIRNCLISCAKQPLPCQPWCHLLPNNMAADQTSAHTHTHTQAQKHTKTHSKPHTWQCPAAVTQRHTHQTSQTQV